MPAFVDISGSRVGRLTVVRKDVQRSTPGNVYWECICDCGTTKSICSRSLLGSRVVSCGCARGRYRSVNQIPLYKVWKGMIDRCTNPNNKSYPKYGGRGITICSRWMESLEAFVSDMGLPTSPKHSLDRINNDGNYEPENCRWATRIQQNRNRSMKRSITWNGETKSISEWAESTGLMVRTIRARIDYMGWSIERALTTPARPLKSRA